MAQFPKLSIEKLIERLKPPTGKIRMILDTDTYNEIDDQFAVVHAMLSRNKLQIEGIHAAPFFNSRSENPHDGMEKSYDEIWRLLDRLDVSADNFVFKGSTDYLRDLKNPEHSSATDHLISRAMAEDDEPLYVVAIGAITNVASAIMIEPKIIEKIVVVWLGGHAHFWNHTREFNLHQDLNASRITLDCGVPFVQIPCFGVADHLLTTVPEMDRYVAGRGEIGDYLVEIFKNYHTNHFGWSKVIWDISATAYLVNPNWVPTNLVHSPILTDQSTWSFDNSRHLIRVAIAVNRDAIFRDLFTKLETGEF